ncbi:MAG: site-specific integrase, partial [Spirochaetaceae bacterium]|nr:site-specific integrase [Spirochaetaceae bacterium]
MKFKDESGSYSAAVSTKQESKAAAIATAFEWLKNGKPLDTSKRIPFSIISFLKQIQTADEAEFVCKELKRRGLLKEFVIPQSKQDVDFTAYLQTFWSYETSPYIKEKLRKNHSIHKNYTIGQKLIVEKYWSPFFRDRLLGGITKQDIEKFIDNLIDHKLSAGRKNTILKAGTIPLRWAFSKEIIEKDIAGGITWFSEIAKKRQILTPEIAEAVFNVEWRDARA